MNTRAQTIARFQRRRANNGAAGAERTAEIYAWAGTLLDTWLTRLGDDRELSDLDPDTIDDFLAAFAKGEPDVPGGFRPHKPGYVNQVYRSLRVLFAWVADRYETPDPMPKVTPRSAGEHELESKVLTEAQLSAILDTVAHNRRNFAAVRDHAMLRVLLNGTRRGEVIGMTLADVDLIRQEARVKGKGDAHGERHRTVAFGNATLEALDDYLELRERHPLAHQPQLWLGARGVLTGRGLHSIVKKRGEQAGIDGVHPHMFRHTYVDRWLGKGGEEGDLMENVGWRSRTMVDRYAKSTKAKRARAAARRMSLDEI